MEGDGARYTGIHRERVRADALLDMLHVHTEFSVEKSMMCSRSNGGVKKNIITVSSQD